MSRTVCETDKGYQPGKRNWQVMKHITLRFDTCAVSIFPPSPTISPSLLLDPSILDPSCLSLIPRPFLINGLGTRLILPLLFLLNPFPPSLLDPSLLPSSIHLLPFLFLLSLILLLFFLSHSTPQKLVIGVCGTTQTTWLNAPTA